MGEKQFQINASSDYNYVVQVDATGDTTLNFPAAGGTVLTTAMQSASSSVFAKTGFSSGATAGALLAGTHNTDGLSLGIPAWLTTAMASNQALVGSLNGSSGTLSVSGSQNVTAVNNASTIILNGPANILNSFSLGGNTGTTNSSNITGGGFVFAGGNNISLSQSNNTISIVAGNYITTAMASNRGSDFVQATAAFAGTNASGTIASGGISVSVAAPGGGDAIRGIAANGSTASTNTVIFSNSNGVSFGFGAAGNSTVLTASHNALTTAAQSTQTLAFSLSGNTATTNSSQISNGAFALAGGNNVTLQQSNNTVSISVGNYITTAMASNRGSDFVQATAAFAGTNASGTIASGGISVSVAAPGGGDAIRGIAANGSTASTNTVHFSNSNGVSFGFGAAGNTTVLTASHNAITTGRASTDAIGLNTAQTNVTWTVNSGGLSLNAGAYLTTARGSTDAIGLNTAQTNVTWTVNSAGISLNAGAYLTTAELSANSSNYFRSWELEGAQTAGTTGSLQGTAFYLSGGNNITLSGNSNTIVISAAGGGANPVISNYRNLVPQNSAQPYTTLAVTFNTLILQPLSPVEELGFPGDMTISTFLMHISGSGTATSLSTAYTSTVRIGLYYLVNSTQITLVNSVSTTWNRAAATGNTTNWLGPRFLTIHSSQWSAQPVLSYRTRYYFGVIHESSSFSAMGAAWMGQYIGASTQRSGSVGVSQAANTSQGMVPFLGIYSAALTTMPGSLGNSQINKVHALAGFSPAVALENIFSAF